MVNLAKLIMRLKQLMLMLHLKRMLIFRTNPFKSKKFVSTKSQLKEMINLHAITIIRTREKEFQENQAHRVKVAVRQLQEISFVQTLQELVEGLNALGATPRDLISILRTLESSGALSADLEVN